MKTLPHVQPPAWPFLAWLSAVLAGIVAPAIAMVLLIDAAAHLVLVGAPILAVGLMGVGMITAATSGRLWVGVILALLTGAALVLLARALGMPALPNPLSTGLVFAFASISFAARGALFARSASDKGWLVALFVVAGEAAIVATASVDPDLLPGWLLALLPAQWASVAIQTTMSGNGIFAASSALIALVGTAAATLFVVWLWPRRWTYLVMFTTWLALSALVYHRPATPLPNAELTVTAAPIGHTKSGRESRDTLRPRELSANDPNCNFGSITFGNSCSYHVYSRLDLVFFKSRKRKESVA